MKEGVLTSSDIREEFESIRRLLSLHTHRTMGGIQYNIPEPIKIATVEEVVRSAIKGVNTYDDIIDKVFDTLHIDRDLPYKKYLEQQQT